MHKRGSNVTISTMVCCKCGQKGIPVPRRAGHERAKDHIKDLWCCNCKKVTKHKEIRFCDMDYVSRMG